MWDVQEVATTLLQDETCQNMSEQLVFLTVEPALPHAMLFMLLFIFSISIDKSNGIIISLSE